MPGILISGPAGAGKSKRARLLRRQQRGRAVLIDYQTIYAALAGIDREDDGRFPERESEDAYLLPTAEFTRRSLITAVIARELLPIVTNSDGNPERRRELLGFMGGGTEEVVDPGIDVVRRRLAGPDGQVSAQCEEAIGRWYTRI